MEPPKGPPTESDEPRRLRKVSRRSSSRGSNSSTESKKLSLALDAALLSGVDTPLLSPIVKSRVETPTAVSRVESPLLSPTDLSSRLESALISSKLTIEKISEVNGNQLPSNHEVLGLFLFYSDTVSKEIHDAKLASLETAKLVYKEISRFYINAKIHMKNEYHCYEKIIKYFTEYRTLKNSQGNSRPGNPTQTRTQKFMEDGSNIFDICHADALLPLDEETKTFVTNQRLPGRVGHMAAIGARKPPPRKRSRIEDPIYDDPSESEGAVGGVVVDATVDEDVDTDVDMDMERGGSKSPIDDIIKDPTYKLPTDRPDPKIDFIDAEMIMAMDSCKMSNPCVMRLLIPTLKALKQDPDRYVLSVSSLSERRQFHRHKSFFVIREEFLKFVKEDGGKPVQVHWDGKAMKNITGNDKVERLPVKVVCCGREQLLGVPVSGKKGKQVCDSVQSMLQEWELEEYVVSCCFDTTRVNSGRVKGAAIDLEKRLGRSLQYMPCRHHIYELILKLAYEHYMGGTKSDRVELFGKFSEQWVDIDQANYSPGIDDPSVNEYLQPYREQTIKFIKERLKKDSRKKFRSDYREFLELSLLFLGEDIPKTKEKNVTFHPPGADHHARWMSKAIYSLKIFLFRELFFLTDKELDGLREFCKFLIRYYLQLWFLSPVASAAPFQDFTFLKSMLLFKTTDEILSAKIIEKFSNHLWYLTEESVALAFFDSTIDIEIQEEMVAKLKFDTDDDDEDEPLTVPQNAHRVVVDVKEITKSFLTKKFSDFITPNTLNFFHRFRIPTEFLNVPPQYWLKNQSYLKGEEIVKNLKVVNDTAERACQVMSEFNRNLTKDEKELQVIMQVNDYYRKSHPSYGKKDLVAVKPLDP